MSIKVLIFENKSIRVGHHLNFTSRLWSKTRLFLNIHLPRAHYRFKASKSLHSTLYTRGTSRKDPRSYELGAKITAILRIKRSKTIASTAN